MKVKIVLEAEVEEEDLVKMGMHNLRYLLTDALHDFESIRVGKRTAEQYVEERYKSSSFTQSAFLKKVSEVEARVAAAKAVCLAAHNAKVSFEDT